jgi:hypothetical protein
VREAIDAIRADTSKYERYAADPQILAVLQVGGMLCCWPHPLPRPYRSPLLLVILASVAVDVHPCGLPLPLPAGPQKMRMLHSVAQANGQRTVDIDSMLAQAREPAAPHAALSLQLLPCCRKAAPLQPAQAAKALPLRPPLCPLLCLQPGWQKRDTEWQLALQAACSAHLAAAAAAAATPPEAGNPADAAQAAYESAFKEAQEAAQGGDKGSSTAAPGATGSTLRRRAAGGTADAGGAKRAAAADAASAQEIEEQERKPNEEDDLPEWMRGGFTWKVCAALPGREQGVYCFNRCRLMAPLLCPALLPAESVARVPAADPHVAAHAGRLPARRLGRARPPAMGTLNRWNSKAQIT